jgi:hypothetical protein
MAKPLGDGQGCPGIVYAQLELPGARQLQFGSGRAGTVFVSGGQNVKKDGLAIFVSRVDLHDIASKLLVVSVALAGSPGLTVGIKSLGLFVCGQQKGVIAWSQCLTEQPGFLGFGS